MTLFHAFEFLPSSDAANADVVAVFGADPTLRSWSINHLVGESDVIQFDGDTASWHDLRDDLATASLFDLGGKKTVVLRLADRFLKDHRAELEDYVAKPSGATRLVLELGSLASNTRLYKALDKNHLLIACSPSIEKKFGVTAASRRKFLTSYVARRHECALASGAADALIEMIGEEIGMIDTEIAKLALYVKGDEPISESLVREIVAGWQGQTVWQITDAIAAGNAAEALRHLDKLMSGGQRPIALLPQIAWSLRRLGLATAVVEHREKMGRSWQLEDALSAAGIQRPAEIGRAKAHLKGIGRTRGRQLLPWLLDADLRLKGTHSSEGRDRFLLEQLVMRLAKSAG